MSLRRQTLVVARYPAVPEFNEVRRILSDAVVDQMLGVVWSAWDSVSREILSEVDLAVADVQLERSLNSQLEMAMQDRLTRQEVFRVQHESYEYETISSITGRPPQYDIAFILRACPRVQWPIEAKVLSTDGAVTAYVADVAEAFLVCIYAPFTGEGAMLGYLREGSVERAFTAISASLNAAAMEVRPAFSDRAHRVTTHDRKVAAGKGYPASMRCHHLIVELKPSSDADEK